MTEASAQSNRLTEKQMARIEQLAGRGLGAWLIGKEIGKASSTVNWYMYRSGLRSPKPLETPKSYQRNGQTVYRFTRDEDAFIEVLRAQGSTFQQIADATNARFGVSRGAPTVKNRLIMLAAAEAAE